MFIAIIGTRFAGKSTVQTYLVKVKDFILVQVAGNASEKVAIMYSSKILESDKSLRSRVTKGTSLMKRVYTAHPTPTTGLPPASTGMSTHGLFPT